MPFPLITSKKPPALSYTRPPPHQRSDHGQSRTSSFTNLFSSLSASQTRAVGGQHRRTTDTTMRISSDRSLTPPRLSGQSVTEDLEGVRTLEIYAENRNGLGGRISPRGSCDVDDEDESIHSSDQLVLTANLPDPDPSPLFLRLDEGSRPKTKLSRAQIANFRRVSASRYPLSAQQKSHFPQSSNAPSSGTEASMRGNGSKTPSGLPSTTLVSAQELGPKHQPLQKSEIAPKTVSQHAYLDTTARQGYFRNSPPSASVYSRREGSPCSRTSRSSYVSDLNRPLPPLPTQDAAATPSVDFLFKRKAVPPPLDLSDQFDSIDMSCIFDPPSPSKPKVTKLSNFLTSPVILSPVNSRPLLTLDQEIRQAVSSRAKEQHRETTWQYYSIASSSAASTPEALQTPKEEGEIHFGGEELDARLADLVVELKRVGRITRDESPRRVVGLAATIPGEDGAKVKQRFSKTPSPTRSKLAHVSSVKAKIETTLPVKIEGGVEREPQQRTARDTAAHAKGCVLDPALRLGKPFTGYNDKMEQRFIPSDQSFEPLRSHRSGPSGSRTLALPTSNEFPFKEMNRKLKPTRTGERVKTVVANFESRGQGTSNTIDPVTHPVTPNQSLVAILERPCAVSSSELTLEGKRIMAEVREKRRR